MTRLPLLLAALTVLNAAIQVSTVEAGPRPVRLAPGDPMPRLEGDLLDGRRLVLPDAVRGRVAFLMLGFTYESRFAVEAWAKWFREALGEQPTLTFYEIPMMGRAARLGRVFIDRGMRRNTPTPLHAHVLTVYGDTGPWKARVGYADAHADDAYLLVVDGAGILRWMHRGPFDPARAAELRALLESLTASQGEDD